MKSQPTPQQAKPEAAPNSGGGNVTIRLSDVAKTYLDALQRLFDFSAMSLGAMRQFNESGYDEFSRGMGVMPSSKARLNYDEAREETERWLLKHVVSEGLGVCVLAMSDARTICALTEWKTAAEKTEEQVKQILGPDKQDYDLLAFTEKFEHLQKNYGVELPLQDNLMRIVKLRQALVARGGNVTEDEATEPGELVLKLKAVQLQTSPISADDLSSMKVSTELSDVERRVAVGQKVRLPKSDHVAVIITFAFFLTGLMESVQRFGRSKGIG